MPQYENFLDLDLEIHLLGMLNYVYRSDPVRSIVCQHSNNHVQLSDLHRDAKCAFRGDQNSSLYDYLNRCDSIHVHRQHRMFPPILPGKLYRWCFLIESIHTHYRHMATP